MSVNHPRNGSCHCRLCVPCYRVGGAERACNVRRFVCVSCMSMVIDLVIWTKRRRSDNTQDGFRVLHTAKVQEDILSRPWHHNLRTDDLWILGRMESLGTSRSSKDTPWSGISTAETVESDARKVAGNSDFPIEFAGVAGACVGSGAGSLAADKPTIEVTNLRDVQSHVYEGFTQVYVRCARCVRSQWCRSF